MVRVSPALVISHTQGTNQVSGCWGSEGVRLNMLSPNAHTAKAAQRLWRCHHSVSGFFASHVRGRGREGDRPGSVPEPLSGFNVICLPW